MRIFIVPMRLAIWWVGICLAVGIYWGTMHLGVAEVTGDFSDFIKGKVVVIDAGHGGIDPGAISASGIMEKDITLQIARYLHLLLHQSGFRVLMVRDGDYDLANPEETNLANRKEQDLSRRVSKATEAAADIYVSIHANFFNIESSRGAQTFYFQSDGEGRRLAAEIQQAFIRTFGPNGRVATTGDYRVLRDTQMPAVLVEVGFLSNEEEAYLLSTEAHQRKVAESIHSGIIRYFINTGRSVRNRQI